MDNKSMRINPCRKKGCACGQANVCVVSLMSFVLEFDHEGIGYMEYSKHNKEC